MAFQPTVEVNNFPLTQTVDGSVTISQGLVLTQTGTSANTTIDAESISVSTAMSSVLSASSSRKGFSIFNNTNRNLYVAIGFSGVATDAATGRFTVRIASNGYFECPGWARTSQVYAGVKDATVTGSINITTNV